MGSNTEKKPWNNLQNLYKKWSKGIKSDNFAIAEKISILELIQYAPLSRVRFVLFKKKYRKLFVLT